MAYFLSGLLALFLISSVHYGAHLGVGEIVGDRSYFLGPYEEILRVIWGGAFLSLGLLLRNDKAVGVGLCVAGVVLIAYSLPPLVGKWVGFILLVCATFLLIYIMYRYRSVFEL